MPIPPLPPISEIQARLEDLFPESFPDRGLLVGTMAARAIFVFLYGGFVQGAARYLRPSNIYLFTEEQSLLDSADEREVWLANANKPGYRPPGTRWYTGDNSRETIRDDLIRGQFRRLGISQRLPGHPVTSSKPIHFLSDDFAALFVPGLTGAALDAELAAWRRRHLSAAELSRMALRAEGAEAAEGDVYIEIPDGTRIRVSAGPSSLIAKGLVEQFAKKHLRRPILLWLSSSDIKLKPELARLAASVGLRFDVKQELPDLILADLSEPARFVFCEIVATDGAMTEARKRTFLDIIRQSGVPTENAEFLTAFEDRKAAPFRKNFSQLAVDSMIWFRTEPGLLLILTSSNRAHFGPKRQEDPV